MLFDYAFSDYTIDFAGFSLQMRAATNFEACVDQMFDSNTFSEAHAPYGAALWPAALALGHALCREPELVRGKRVIELGCGTGLAALVAAKLGAQVMASDFHPDMGHFVAMNAEKNGITLPYQRLDWADLSAVQEHYEVIIASDVLYDATLAPLCLNAIEHLLAPGGLVLISDPQRGQLQRMRKGLAERDFVWVERQEPAAFAGQHASCIIFAITRPSFFRALTTRRNGHG